MNASLSSPEVQLFTPLGVLFIIGVTIFAVVAVCQWRKVRVAEIEATLKQQMLDRGMSADEIVRVLAATSDGHSRMAWCNGEVDGRLAHGKR
jgi:uncharacterized membrane protein YciS (DUF1049 family)